MSLVVESEAHRTKRKRKPRARKRPAISADQSEPMAPDAPQETVPHVENETAKEPSWGEATRRARGFNVTWQNFKDAAHETVDFIFSMGAALEEAKQEIKAKGGDWLDMFDPAKVDEPITFGGLTQRAAQDKAEDLRLIDRYSSELRSANLRNLPPTISGLATLARLEKKKPGTVAQATADGRIFADMTVRDVEALEWSKDELTTLFLLKKEEPRAAAPPKRPPQMTESERAYRHHVEVYEAARFARSVNALELSGVVRHSVTCNLCGQEHLVENDGQEGVTTWIVTHIDETHAADKWHVAVRYVIEKATPHQAAVVEAPVATPVPYDPMPIYATGSTRTVAEPAPATSSVIQLFPNREAYRATYYKWSDAVYYDDDVVAERSAKILHHIILEYAEGDLVVAAAMTRIDEQMPWYRRQGWRLMLVEEEEEGDES